MQGHPALTSRRYAQDSVWIPCNHRQTQRDLMDTRRTLKLVQGAPPQVFWQRQMSPVNCCQEVK